MARQCYFPVITTLLTCLLVGALSASPEEAVFWVAPTLEQCGNRTAGTANVQCNTLKGYQKNSSIFSTSHSKWIFLKGEHYMADSPITVSGATNITWTGEETCALSMVRCVISIPACRRYSYRIGGYYSTHFTTITVQNTQSLQFALLIFSTMLQDTFSCNVTELCDNNSTLYYSLLTLKNVSNAEITSTVIAAIDNYLEMPTSHVLISDPRGTWVFNQTVCSHTDITMDITHCHAAFANTSKCNFSAIFASSVLYCSTLATTTGASVSDTYNAVKITFLQSSIFGFDLTSKGYAADRINVTIMECNFAKMYFKLPVFSIPETQHDIAAVSILLWKVNFQCYPKPCHMLLVFLIQDRTKYNSGCGLLLLNITMSQITAVFGAFGLHVIGPNFFDTRTWYNGCNRTTPFHVLTIHDCIFESLVYIDAQAHFL